MTAPIKIDQLKGNGRYFLFSSILCALYVLLLALVPATFLLHSLHSDRLNYFLMAKGIVDNGSPIVSYAVNSPPLVYASGMSFVYALPIKLSGHFEYQLLGMQVINLLLMFGFATLALRYVVSRLPGVPVAPVAFLIAGSLLLDSHWQLSILLPNADILPALLTVGCFLAFQEKGNLMTAPSWWTPRVKIAASIAIGGIGSLIKMSLITIPIALILERFVSARSFKKVFIALVGMAALGAATLYLTSSSVATEYIGALIRGYLFPAKDPSVARLFSSIYGSAVNLMCSALPDRIIPNFRHIFVESVNVNTFNPKTLTPFVAFGIILGLCVSAITAIGIMTFWQSSKLETIMLLLCLPVFMIVTNSTARYLMAFQPLIWAGFIAGILKLRPYLPRIRAVLLLPAALLILMTQINSLSLRGRGDVDLITRISEISRVYDGMLNYLRNQDASTTLGILHFKFHHYSTMMMWRAATEIPFYVPDDGFSALVKSRRVLAIITCAKPDCNDFEMARLDTFSHIEKTGRYKYNLVFSEQSSIARGEIYVVSSD